MSSRETRSSRSTRYGKVQDHNLGPSYKRRLAWLRRRRRRSKWFPAFFRFIIDGRRLPGGGSVPGPVLGAYCWALPPAPRGCLIITRLLFPVPAPSLPPSLTLRSSPTMIFMDQTSAGKLAPPGSQGQSRRKLRTGSASGSSASGENAERTKPPT